jgi:hypothetical protein
MKKLNLINKKFGRLLVIREVDIKERTSGRVSWLCKCDCGKEVIIEGANLVNNHTRSCGCLNDEMRVKRAKHMYKVNIKYTPRITSARRIWLRRYHDADLTFDDFYKLSQMNCYYCGLSPNNKANSAKENYKSSQEAKENGDFIYNGLDRIDNSKGHTLENCVSCCKFCNRAKMDMTIDEFKELIIRIYKIFINKGL